MESRAELFARIRRDARVEGLSVRALAVRHGVHRRTVRQALESAAPPERKPRQGVSWRLEPFKPAIDAVLLGDTTAPRKQRHTARRILARLIEEHGAAESSYSTVRDHVRVWRTQIDGEAGRRVEVFVPQEHAPGAEAEVDFGEVWVVLAGVKTECHMCVFRLSHSGKAIHRITRPRPRKRFWKATSTGSMRSAACRSGTSAMTISPVLSLPWCSGRAGSARRMTGGCCSGPTTASTPSTANPASPGAREGRGRGRSGLVSTQQALPNAGC
jgi:lambda repressor-like predicted transcriptional regulator